MKREPWRSLIALGEWKALRRRHELTPCLGAVALFLMSFIGIAISLWPSIVPYRYTLWQAALSPSTQAFLLIGTDHPDVYRLVLLAVPRRRARHGRLSLRPRRKV
jgi:hypothetical protein